MSSETWTLCLPRSFRRRLRNDLRLQWIFVIIIARCRETEEPRERARTFFFFFLYLSLIRDTKTERPMSSDEVLCFLSSAIVPTTPSERSQTGQDFFHHHRSTPRNRTTARARTRAPSSFFFYISSCTERTKTDELRTPMLF